MVTVNNGNFAPLSIKMQNADRQDMQRTTNWVIFEHN